MKAQAAPGSKAPVATRSLAAAPPANPRRKVDALASTPYAVDRNTLGGVILSCGKNLEHWGLVAFPNKSYAISIDGLEYEFESKC